MPSGSCVRSRAAKRRRDRRACRARRSCAAGTRGRRADRPRGAGQPVLRARARSRAGVGGGGCAAADGAPGDHRAPRRSRLDDHGRADHACRRRGRAGPSPACSRSPAWTSAARSRCSMPRWTPGSRRGRNALGHEGALAHASGPVNLIGLLAGSVAETWMKTMAEATERELDKGIKGQWEAAATLQQAEVRVVVPGHDHLEDAGPQPPRARRRPGGRSRPPLIGVHALYLTNSPLWGEKDRIVEWELDGMYQTAYYSYAISVADLLAAAKEAEAAEAAEVSELKAIGDEYEKDRDTLLFPSSDPKGKTPLKASSGIVRKGAGSKAASRTARPVFRSCYRGSGGALGPPACRSPGLAGDAEHPVPTGHPSRPRRSRCRESWGVGWRPAAASRSGPLQRSGRSPGGREARWSAGARRWCCGCCRCGHLQWPHRGRAVGPLQAVAPDGRVVTSRSCCGRRAVCAALRRSRRRSADRPWRPVISRNEQNARQGGLWTRTRCRLDSLHSNARSSIRRRLRRSGLTQYSRRQRQFYEARG